jgi:hypothetical protein
LTASAASRAGAVWTWGAGAIGILGALSRRVGPGGHVVGVDRDPQQLAAARAYVHEAALGNVEVLDRDAYATGLPDQSFDLVHVRFVFAPVGRDDALLAEMRRLARPAWDRLKGAILAAFKAGGGDFDAGLRTYELLRRAGVADVQVRAAVVALQDRHPSMRLPIQFATPLRQRIITGSLLPASELDELLAAGERITQDPGTWVTTSIVTHVWGHVPS